MGIVFVEGVVKGEKGEENVKFLVDTGAFYTVLKKEVWQKVGIKPQREVELVLADGTTVRRQVGEVFIKLKYGECHTPVILGESEDENLLGTVTLEILDLMVDPLKREIRPNENFSEVINLVVQEIVKPSANKLQNFKHSNTLKNSKPSECENFWEKFMNATSGKIRNPVNTFAKDKKGDSW